MTPGGVTAGDPTPSAKLLISLEKDFALIYDLYNRRCDS